MEGRSASFFLLLLFKKFNLLYLRKKNQLPARPSALHEQCEFYFSPNFLKKREFVMKYYFYFSKIVEILKYNIFVLFCLYPRAGKMQKT